MIASEHLSSYLDPDRLAERLIIAEEVLRNYDFDTIAFRGMSGALVAPALALNLNKQLILVRKPNDSTHSLLRIEGYLEARKYIIVDDFVSSGTTKRAIIEAVSKFAPDASFVGLLPMNSMRRDNVDRAPHPYPLS